MPTKMDFRPATLDFCWTEGDVQDMAYVFVGFVTAETSFTSHIKASKSASADILAEFDVLSAYRSDEDGIADVAGNSTTFVLRLVEPVGQPLTQGKYFWDIQEDTGPRTILGGGVLVDPQVTDP